MTTITDPVRVSLEEGHVTLPPSLLTSCINFKGFIIFFLKWQERRDSNPQPPVLETGALPVELHSSSYSTISVTTPEPTVLPPSRIANLTPLSIAIGAIISTSIAILSPGMTISVPAGKEQTPVTSVVLK